MPRSRATGGAALELSAEVVGAGDVEVDRQTPRKRRPRRKERGEILVGTMVPHIKHVRTWPRVRHDRVKERFADSKWDDPNLLAPRPEKVHQVLHGPLVIGDHACRAGTRPTHERLIVRPHLRLEVLWKPQVNQIVNRYDEARGDYRRHVLREKMD